MATAIIVSQIPGATLDPDAVETAATDLKTQAGLVRDAGTDVKVTWQGLTYAYTAPESESLLAVMDPVATDSDMFADDLDRVAAALSAFAAEARVIKAALDRVRIDARVFHREISGDTEWNQNQDHVDTNNDLRRRVADEQVRLWDAERTCANAIRAIDDIAPWHAWTGEDDDGYSFGYSEISDDAEMAWGSPIQREDECPKSAAVGVKRFVWDGIVVDIVVEGLLGIGGLVGLGTDGWSLETLSATWGGLGTLIGRDPTSGEWAWGTAGEAWVGTGKALVAWDMWAEDPARAAGTLVGNIVLTAVTFGAGGAAKGVSVVGRTGTRMARARTAVLAVNKLIDPIDLATGAAAALKGIDLTTLRAALGEGLTNIGTILKTTVRGVDVDVHVDLPNGHLDAPGIREVDPAPPRAVDVDGNATAVPETNAPHRSEHFNDNADAGTVSVREPEVALVGGHGAPDGPGSGSGGSGDAGTGGDSGGGSASDGDVAGPQNPAETPPQGGNTSSLGAAVADQTSYLDVLDDQLRQHNLTEPQFRTLVETPLDKLSKSQVETLIAIRDALPGVDGHTVLQKIITPDMVVKLFTDLEKSLDLSTPQGLLDKAALDRLRQEHADVFAAAASKYESTVVTGFVSRTADVNHLSTQELYNSLGLGYIESPFATLGPSGEAINPLPNQTMFGIEFKVGETPKPSQADYTLNTINKHFDELQGLSGPDYKTRLTELVEQDFLSENPGKLSDAQSGELVDRLKHVAYACDIKNPHRGNGFGGAAGSYTPELQFSYLAELEKGAELWKIAPDGERVPVARFDGDDWRFL